MATQPTKTKDSRINTSLAPETHRDLKRMAGVLGLTVSDAAEEAVQDWLTKNRRKARKVAEQLAA